MKQHNTFFNVFARIIALAILLQAPVHAQTYPVQTHVVTSGPYFNYLSYYGDQNNHLQVIVTMLDFNLPPVMARLRIRIEGPGYELYTNPNAVVGQPFLLEGGVPVNLSGIDLLPYLQQNNLIVSPQGLDINALPEGFTTVCVDVIKDGTNQEVLSTNNCTAFSLFKFQPPQTFLPQCATELDTTQMFYNFQWSPPIGYTPDLNSELLYTFSLYRWNDPSNYSIFTTDQGLVWRETDLTMAQTQVSDLDVAFELGGLYVWRVEAQITSNGMPVNMILNNGFSENCTFTFGQAQTLAEVLSDGLYIDLFAEPSAENKGKAYWVVIDNTPNVGLSTFDQFFVEFRKQPTGNEGFEIPWFSETVTDFDLFIYQLEPSTTYEVKVSGIVGGVVGDPTPVKNFTTPAARVYACGESDLPFLPSTFTPLENATAGIQVQIGQFKMDISEITPTGSTGHYEGKGTIPIAFLAGAKAKVTFEDILIDTEYKVREGRVDVITQGLENWLNEQYEQFIDPIYVNGTVDSAYVDSNGVAWVVVDGVNQSFTFDPPTYPIIINDASGYQYTIYPNGTVVISIYLEVSEYWTVSPNEVVHFGQNENESRGFDGKEFIQWHEQYEVMQLSDSSFYFVANKSMAANEADVVNVQLPPGNGNVSFQFEDGSPVTSAPLTGTWMGDAPHGSAQMKTLSIPARSAGIYQIHAYANNTKEGQLNVFVYSKKEKELVVVPLVSNFTLSDAQIEAELDETLGEANIDVEVTVAPQWNDTTFTASTTISLPTDVGLMNKYSDDMKALRDAYLEANPNADKTKFYLFVVAGFDDPSEMGYMVRGRSMGFIRGGNPNLLETISHELGHGMGALEHSWKDNGPNETTTSNLMDYASTSSATTSKNNLTRVQWKELRDADFVPSLFDEVDDYLSAIASLSFDQVSEDKPSISIPAIHKSNIPVERALMTSSGVLVRFSNTVRSNFTHFAIHNGKLIGLWDNDAYMPLVARGYATRPADVNNTTFQQIVDSEVGIVVFLRTDSLSAQERVLGKALKGTELIDIITGYASGDVLGIELVDCNDVDGEYVEDYGVEMVIGQVECPADGECASNDLAEVSYGHKIAVKNAFRTIIQSANGGFDWNPIQFVGDHNHVLSVEDQKVIKEKIRTLNSFRNDVIVGVVVMKGSFNQLYTITAADELAHQAVSELALEFPNKKLVLFFTHYINGSNENLFTTDHFTCVTSSFAKSEQDLVNPLFISDQLSIGSNVMNNFLLLFTEIKKPYYLTNIYKHYDGSLSYLQVDQTSDASKDIYGIPFVKGARHLVSVNNDAYNNLINDISNCVGAMEFQGSQWTMQGPNLTVAEATELYAQKVVELESMIPIWKEESRDNPNHWIAGETDFSNIREHYLNSGVALYEFKKQTAGFAFLNDLAIVLGASSVSSDMYYEFDIMSNIVDPVVYGVVDLLGVIPGVDFLADGVGVLYSTARGDAESIIIYSTALAVPFVGAGIVHSGQKYFNYYAKESNQNIVDVVVKQWDEPHDGWIKISNDIPYEDATKVTVKNELVGKIPSLSSTAKETIKKVVVLKQTNGITDQILEGVINGVRRYNIGNEIANGISEVTRTISLGGKTMTLKWKVVNGAVDFTSPSTKSSLRSQLSTFLGTTPGVDAHHILPLGKCGHPVVIQASKNGYHPNIPESIIGLEHYDAALQVGLHQNHPAYDLFIESRLDDFMDLGDMSPEACNDFIQKVLVPELKIEIFNAKNSTSKNLNTYFNDIVNPQNGI